METARRIGRPAAALRRPLAATMITDDYWINGSRMNDFFCTGGAGLAGAAGAGAGCAAPVGVVGSMKVVGADPPAGGMGDGVADAGPGGGSSGPWRPQAASASGRTNASASARSPRALIAAKTVASVPCTARGGRADRSGSRV